MEGRYPLTMAEDQGTELSELESGLLSWLVESDFHIQPWSTSKAAKAFKVKQDEIYDALSALTRKVPKRIQISYKDGSLRVAAE